MNFLRKFLNLHTKISMENWLLKPFFYPIFQDLCHFIHLWKITPFFYNNFFRFRGRYYPLPSLRAPLFCIISWKILCFSINYRVFTPKWFDSRNLAKIESFSKWWVFFKKWLEYLCWLSLEMLFMYKNNLALIYGQK